MFQKIIIINLILFHLISCGIKEEYNSSFPSYENLYTTAINESRWTHIGPQNIGGRTRSILVQGESASSTHTLYAGGVTGGVFKSTDGGESWYALNDLMPNLNINTLAQDPNNNNVIYAGTGEWGGGFIGAGIFKTTNGGVNWSQLDNTTEYYYVQRIVVSPNDSNVVYAATYMGLYKSSDAGKNWTKINSGSHWDVAIINKNNTDYVYAFIKNNGLMVSFDSGNQFNYKIGSSGDNTSYSRGTIAFSKSNSAIGYLLVAQRTESQIFGIWKTTDYGENWSQTISQDNDHTKTDSWLLSYSADVYDHDNDGDNCNDGAFDHYAQGTYDQYIEVDPTDPEVVWVGGIELFRSDSGASSGSFKKASLWYSTEKFYNHADQHFIVFSPTYDAVNDKRVYFGNDGGVFLSTNTKDGVTQDPCNANLIGVEYTEIVKGYGTTQFYHGLVSKDGKFVIGGLQDQGVPLYHGSTDNWTTIGGGDGAYNAIDPDNSSIMYSSYIYIDSISRHNISVDKETGDISDYYGTKISGTIDTSTYGKGSFINPFVLDKDNTTNIYTANLALWRSDNSTASSVSWSNLGTFDGQNSGNELTIAPSNNKVLYVGVGYGKLYKILNPELGP